MGDDLSAEPRDQLRQAAAGLAIEGPAALLVGPRLAADPELRPILEQLAARLGATGDDGMVGSPALAANGRGVQELAPDLAAVDPTAAGGPLAAQPAALLMLDVGGPWPPLSGTNLIVATSGPIDERDEVEVVLPLAHPYEQAGSLTNLEGRVQKLEPSGFAAPTTLADWAALARLVNALGGAVPTDLPGLRAALAADHPKFARALTGSLPAAGRRLEEAGVA